MPLNTAEDAVTAAVRLGYQVIDGQIERGLDMARRLRGAAARSGSAPASMLDDAERMISKGVLLGLEWLESTAAQPGGPLVRLIAAQSKMLNTLLGVATPEPLADQKRTPKPPADRAPATPPEEVPPTRQRRVSPLRIRHLKDSTKRAVSVVRCDTIPTDRTTEASYRLTFHSVQHRDADQIAATLIAATTDPDAVLEVATKNDQPSGLWRAAVCDSSGNQLGIIEIEL